MGFSKEEVDLAVQYVEDLEITAMLDPKDNKTLIFGLSDPLPDQLSIETREIIEICVECHKQAVFTGEYHVVYEDNFPPDPGTDNVLEEINFYLKYYKKYLKQELLKGFDSCGEPEEAPEPKIEPKISPFAETMMADMEKRKKNELPRRKQRGIKES